MKCKATKKSGEPCGAVATEEGFCAFHGDPKRAAELGRMLHVRNLPETRKESRPYLGALPARLRLAALLK